MPIIGKGFMRYVLLAALFWHQAVVPVDINNCFKNTLNQCSQMCAAFFCNDVRANYIIASAAITAGVTSFCYFLKKAITKLHTSIKGSVKSPNPRIEVTHKQGPGHKKSMSPSQRQSSPSNSILLSPSISPYQSRPASRRNSRNCELHRHSLNMITEQGEDEIELLRSMYKGDIDKPLTTEEIDALLAVPDVSQPPPSTQKKSMREEMFEHYNQFPVDAEPLEVGTRTGIYWLGWTPPVHNIKRLSLTFNGEEIYIPEPRTAQNNN